MFTHWYEYLDILWCEVPFCSCRITYRHNFIAISAIISNAFRTLDSSDMKQLAATVPHFCLLKVKTLDKGTSRVPHSLELRELQNLHNNKRWTVITSDFISLTGKTSIKLIGSVSRKRTSSFTVKTRIQEHPFSGFRLIGFLCIGYFR